MSSTESQKNSLTNKLFLIKIEFNLQFGILVHCIVFPEWTGRFWRGIKSHRRCQNNLLVEVAIQCHVACSVSLSIQHYCLQCNFGLLMSLPSKQRSHVFFSTVSFLAEIWFLYTPHHFFPSNIFYHRSVSIFKSNLMNNFFARIQVNRFHHVCAHTWLCPYMIVPIHDCAHTRLCLDMFVSTHACAHTRLCPLTFVHRHICAHMIVPETNCGQTRSCPWTIK